MRRRQGNAIARQARTARHLEQRRKHRPLRRQDKFRGAGRNRGDACSNGAEVSRSWPQRFGIVDVVDAEMPRERGEIRFLRNGAGGDESHVGTSAYSARLVRSYDERADGQSVLREERDLDGQRGSARGVQRACLNPQRMRRI